jgi:hypothetical protein
MITDIARRPIEIFLALPSYQCLILFFTNIILKVQYFPYMKYDVTHILTSLKNDVKVTEKENNMIGICPVKTFVEFVLLLGAEIKSNVTLPHDTFFLPRSP